MLVIPQRQLSKDNGTGGFARLTAYEAEQTNPKVMAKGINNVIVNRNNGSFRGTECSVCRLGQKQLTTIYIGSWVNLAINAAIGNKFNSND